jgi:hypothetical protein
MAMTRSQQTKAIPMIVLIIFPFLKFLPEILFKLFSHINEKFWAIENIL